MEEITSCPVSTCCVGKARKKNGYYTCPIYSNKKHPFYVQLNHATIMSIKDVGNTVVLRCKNALSYMDELTSVLLKVVELNHTEWFNSSIDDSFIEEYFTNPIHYDNKNGIVLRLKLKNIDEIEHIHVHNKVNITLVLKNITFLRQKFYPVFEVHSISVIEHHGIHGDEQDEDDGLEDDEVVPSFDEVLAMKQEKITKLQRSAEALTKTIEASKTRLEQLNSNILQLQKCKSMNEILILCEELEKDC